MFCPFCGNENRADKKFCRQCGRNLPPPKRTSITDPTSLKVVTEFNAPLPELAGAMAAGEEITHIPGALPNSLSQTPEAQNHANQLNTPNALEEPTVQMPVEAWAEVLEDTVAPEQWMGSKTYQETASSPSQTSPDFQTGDEKTLVPPNAKTETPTVEMISEADRPTAKLPKFQSPPGLEQLVAAKLVSPESANIAVNGEVPAINTPYKVLRKKKKLRDSISMSISAFRERVNDTGASITDSIVRNRKSSRKEEWRGFIWFGITLLAIIILLLVLNSAVGSGLVQYLEGLYLELQRPNN
jgi:hypothetical protein